MAFELAILLSTVLVPAAVTSIGAVAEWASPKSPHSHCRMACIVALLGPASIWLATGLRNGFRVWPTDSWLCVPVAGMLVAIAGAATCFNNSKDLRWVVRSVAVLAASWWVLPSSEGFAELMPTLPRWQFCMAASVIVGWWLIEQIQASRVPAVTVMWLVLFGVGMVLVGQSFAKLAEIMLAIGTVWLVVGLMAGCKRNTELIRVAAGPILFAFVASVANGQFNSFLGLPDWLSLLVIAGPVVVASPMLWPARGRFSWLPITVAGFLTVVIASCVAGMSLQSYEG